MYVPLLFAYLLLESSFISMSLNVFDRWICSDVCDVCWDEEGTEFASAKEEELVVAVVSVLLDEEEDANKNLNDLFMTDFPLPHNASPRPSTKEPPGLLSEITSVESLPESNLIFFDFLFCVGLALTSEFSRLDAFPSGRFVVVLNMILLYMKDKH